MDQFLFGIFQIDKNYFKILVQNLYYTLNVKPRCQIFTTIYFRSQARGPSPEFMYSQNTK